jgi:hypothetical protein
MIRRWFETWGWIYRPVAWQEHAVALLGIATSLHVFMVVDARSRSISDTLYGIFPFIILFWALVFRLASKTSTQES